jgi:hypothetical protein
MHCIGTEVWAKNFSPSGINAKTRIPQALILRRCENSRMEPEIRGYDANYGEVPPKVKRPALSHRGTPRDKGIARQV